MVRIVIDLPAAVCLEHPDSWFIGPTAVDLAALEDAQKEQLIRQSEAKMLAAYRKRDLAHYSHQTQRPKWRSR